MGIFQFRLHPLYLGRRYIDLERFDLDRHLEVDSSDLSKLVSKEKLKCCDEDEVRTRQ